MWWGLDSFGRPETLAKVFRKLVESYALDAVDWSEAGKDDRPSGAEVRTYLETARTSPVESHSSSGWGCIVACQKYPEFYAQAKALERDGPGQDLALARHFMERFTEDIARMLRRLSENVRSRVAQIGATGKFPAAPALARLPYRYGRQIRRGY